MTSKGLLDAWLKFWFALERPNAIGLFRICFGLLVLDACLFHIGPDVLDWYGPHGVTSNDAVHQFWWQNEPRFDIFLLAPQTDAGIMAAWYIYVAAAIAMLVGWRTREAAIVVTLYLISMDNRQPFAINGGDAMMRLLAGYLIFTEAGSAFSVDRLIQRWKNPTFGVDSQLKPVPHWGQRMIQVQMALTYWSTFCAKISGAQWIDGTAVYFATRLDDMINHPMFLYDSMFFCKFLTWYTLVFEGAMFCLVWIRDLRYWILAGTLVMHLGIDWSINLPIFEWIFMTSFLVFLYPEDLTKVMNFIKYIVLLKFGPPAKLIYDPKSSLQTSQASVLEGLDVFGRLTIQPLESAEMSLPEIVGMSRYGTLARYDLLAWLSARLPLLWPLYPIIGLPWYYMTPHATQASTAEVAKLVDEATASVDSPAAQPEIADAPSEVVEKDLTSTAAKETLTPLVETEKTADEQTGAKSEEKTDADVSTTIV